jgi:hypothetical protein
MERLRLSDLSAVHLEDSGEVTVLGFLHWNSVSEQLVRSEDLLEIVRKSGLEDGFMPPPIRVPDAFRRATKAIECRREAGDKVVHKFLVREVVSDKERVVRRIVREIINSKNEDLDYEKEEAVLVLDKETELMSYSSINQESEALAAEAARLFEIYKSNYDGRALRSMVLNVIKSMAPITMRSSGGVYFIPAKFHERLHALQEFLKNLGKAEGHVIPMINTKENLELVRKEAVKTVQNTFSKLQQAVSNPETPSNEISNLICETEVTLHVVEEYREVLMQDLSNFDKSVLAMQKMLKELKGRQKRVRKQDSTDEATRLIRV